MFIDRKSSKLELLELAEVRWPNSQIDMACKLCEVHSLNNSDNNVFLLENGNGGQKVLPVTTNVWIHFKKRKK